MKINYYINEEERTIVCVLSHCYSEAYRYIGKHLTYYWMDTTLLDKLRMPDRFIGKATCAAGDTWDESYGRKLAYFRAKRKFDRNFANKVSTFIIIMNRNLGDLRDIMLKKIDKLAIAGDKLGRELHK
jgi:hypothetical protein